MFTKLITGVVTEIELSLAEDLVGWVKLIPVELETDDLYELLVEKLSKVAIYSEVSVDIPRELGAMT